MLADGSIIQRSVAPVCLLSCHNDSPSETTLYVCSRKVMAPHPRNARLCDNCTQQCNRIVVVAYGTMSNESFRRRRTPPAKPCLDSQLCYPPNLFRCTQHSTVYHCKHLPSPSRSRFAWFVTDSALATLNLWDAMPVGRHLYPERRRSDL